MVLGLGPAIVLGGLGVAGAVTVVVLAAMRPPVTEGVVLATAPWMVVGGILAGLSDIGAYGTLVLVDTPQVHLTALVIGGLVWAPLVQGAIIRERRPATPRYLTAAGVGAAVVLTAVLFLLTAPSSAGIVWLVSLPVAAGILAAGEYLFLGLLDATPLAHTRFAGLLALYAHTLAGLATTVSVDLFGRSPRGMAALVAEASGSLPIAGVGWLVLPLRIGIALLAVLALGRYAREAETRAYLALIVFVAIGLGPAVVTLLELGVG